MWTNKELDKAEKNIKNAFFATGFALLVFGIVIGVAVGVFVK